MKPLSHLRIYFAQIFPKIPSNWWAKIQVFSLFRQDNTNLKHVYDEFLGGVVSLHKFRHVCSKCWEEDDGVLPMYMKRPRLLQIPLTELSLYRHKANVRSSATKVPCLRRLQNHYWLFRHEWLPSRQYKGYDLFNKKTLVMDGKSSERENNGRVCWPESNNVPLQNGRHRVEESQGCKEIRSGQGA
jgi:hypothetical protein